MNDSDTLFKENTSPDNVITQLQAELVEKEKLYQNLVTNYDHKIETLRNDYEKKIESLENALNEQKVLNKALNRIIVSTELKCTEDENKKKDMDSNNSIKIDCNKKDENKIIQKIVKSSSLDCGNNNL